MYKAIPGGSTEQIYKLEVNLPPPGYVFNVFTGKVEEREIHKFAMAAHNQVWERTPLPKDWRQKRAKELAVQMHDPEYYDPELERFRQQEWDRRLNGFWFYNNGQPTYLTGVNYMYLNWWRLDVGYPKYFDNDRRYWNHLMYCIEDPKSFGMMEVTKRRQGKTMRAGLFLYEYTSRTSDSYGGIQSKTLVDARKQVFQKALVQPFRALPDFFIPVYDTSQGDFPKSELRMYRPSQKGKAALERLGVNAEDEELRSEIDFRSSDEFAYDGTKRHRIVQDEFGKCVEANVYDRHEVIKPCLLDENFNVIGKALYTTTVEEMENGGANAKRLWEESDPRERNANGFTQSGLYHYFLPAYKTLNIDKYGIADEDKAKKFFLTEREGIKDNRKLSAFIRKNPFTIEEAFRVDGDTCMYDAVVLNDQRDWITWQENLYTRGNFVWKNGERFSSVDFVPDTNGRWKVSWLFSDQAMANRVDIIGSEKTPKNRYAFAMGVDPYDHDTTVEGRHSNGAFYVKKKFSSVTDDPHSDAFIVEYVHRPPTAAQFYEDVLKTAWYYGTDFLFEDQKQGIKRYFEDANCIAFLAALPGSDKVGISSSPKSKQEMSEYTENYIYESIKKVVFPQLIEDWLNFDIRNTEKYDSAMAAGWTLVHDAVILKKGKPEAEANEYGLRDFFRRHKV